MRGHQKHGNGSFLNGRIDLGFPVCAGNDLSIVPEPNPEGVGPVMANGFCNFIRQIEFPGEIIARHYVDKPGTKSIDTYFTLSMSDAPDVISANGGATLVWLDFPNKKTVALPDDLRAACS